MTATRRALLTVAPVAALATSAAASHRVIGRWTRIERAGALFA